MKAKSAPSSTSSSSPSPPGATVSATPFTAEKTTNFFSPRRPSTHIPDKIAGVPVTRIGAITKSRHMKLTKPDGTTPPLNPQGWQHFA